MFNSDSIFHMGRTHEECEDYALSGEIRVGQDITPWRYAIVCDGCSSSNAVSLGARILAFSALNWLPNILLQSADVLGAYIGTSAREALKPFDNLQLNTSILDATLLMAACEPTSGSTAIMVWGDGVLVIRSAGVTRLVVIDYESGAPFYLSYGLDANRHLGYVEKYGKDNRVTEEFFILPDGKVEAGERVITPHYQQFFTAATLSQPGDFVALMSDGPKQFSDGTGTKIPVPDVVKPLTAFKSFNGRFVGRRVGMYLKDCHKNGITFADDLSLATIIREK